MMFSGHLIHIDSLTDPRIAAYLNLKERELARHGGRFIAEGELVVRRLLDSDYPVESILLADRRAEEIAPLAPPGVPVYVAPAERVNRMVGFKFHSGVIACGMRKPPLSLEAAAQSWGDRPVTLVICPEIANTDNLGSLIRISSALGATAMVLGERCCDPFFRQSIRVSMGTIFRMPLVRSRNVLEDLVLLRQRWGVQLLATVLADDAEDLSRADRPGRIGILLGNEAQGLRLDEIAACDRRITIPMRLGTDSLNVSVAAGIVMYHFTQYAQAR
jgi:tRNA G18 (ribose-2'-O)-methylase SpoU